MNIEFSGKTVFITGAARGIGKAIADAFDSTGASLVIPTRAELDLSNADSISAYLSRNTDFCPDILVFNAAVNDVSLIENLDLDKLFLTFQTNLFSAVQILKAVIPSLKSKMYGKIVFISSAYAHVTREGRSTYASSKHAVTGLVKTMALELAPYNILVNSVAPGYVLTDMTNKNLTQGEINKINESIPTGRFQSEKEIAAAVLFLASEYNKSITGQWLAVDGGFILR